MASQPPREFLDTKLQPAPLRLGRKSQTDMGNAQQQSPTRSPAKNADTLGRHAPTTFMTFLELTPPVRTTAPGLAGLLDNPSKARTQDRSRLRTEPRPVFAEGSPFGKPPRVSSTQFQPYLADHQNKPLAKQGDSKTEARKGWDPKTVTERRKVFEQTPRNDPFTAPIITRASVRSSKPVVVKHDQFISSLRASRVGEIEGHSEDAAHLTAPRPSHSRSKSNHTDLYDVSSLSRKISSGDTIRRKRHSVADLRRAFETSFQSTSKHDSVPNTPTRPTSLRTSFTASRGPEPTTTLDVKANSKSLDHTGEIKPSPSHPSLLSRALSVKTATVKPNSPKSVRQESVVTRPQGRRTLPGPPPAPYLQQWRTRRDTVPVKAGPSLPIVVSTTVAVTTRRQSSGGSSSRRSTPYPKRDDLRRKSTGSSSYIRGFQDGPGEAPSSTSGDSPVKERISLFERLSQSESRPGRAGKSLDVSTSSSSSKRDQPKRNPSKRPSASEPKRGARALRALSFTKRRESNVRDALLGASSASKFPVRLRHSIAAAKQASIKTGEEDIAGRLQDAQAGVKGKAVVWSDRLSLAPQPESTLFVRGTLWKVPHWDQNSSKVAPVSTDTANTTESNTTDSSSSSAELVKKTIDRPPTLFHASSSKSGRILPDRKSYGALENKTSWDTNTTATLADPVLDLTGAVVTTNASVHSIESNVPSVIHKNLTSPAQNTPTITIAEPPRRRSLHPTSWGRKAGDAWKKSVVGPVLSPEPAHATKGDSAGRRHTFSWGKRAAAAAMGISRRLKERRATSLAAKQGSRSREGSSAGVVTPHDD
ncbi:hypothetical protein QBC35DRAFT_475095 [Podospora australis]|uniref:Uncharacterized protein n=1 Tax=Podospora australis TaxID=1536484 RepID=A0AAN7AFK4_9PEZI|nr:hypothetical protein QBC35DRAFT_475095 [Podospora australis]